MLLLRCGSSKRIAIYLIVMLVSISEQEEKGACIREERKARQVVLTLKAQQRTAWAALAFFGHLAFEVNPGKCAEVSPQRPHPAASKPA